MDGLEKWGFPIFPTFPDLTVAGVVRRRMWKYLHKPTLSWGKISMTYYEYKLNQEVVLLIEKAIESWRMKK